MNRAPSRSVRASAIEGRVSVHGRSPPIRVTGFNGFECYLPHEDLLGRFSALLLVPAALLHACGDRRSTSSRRGRSAPANRRSREGDVINDPNSGLEPVPCLDGPHRNSGDEIDGSIGDPMHGRARFADADPDCSPLPREPAKRRSAPIRRPRRRRGPDPPDQRPRREILLPAGGLRAGQIQRSVRRHHDLHRLQLLYTCPAGMGCDETNGTFADPPRRHHSQRADHGASTGPVPLAPVALFAGDLRSLPGRTRSAPA